MFPNQKYKLNDMRVIVPAADGYWVALALVIGVVLHYYCVKHILKGGVIILNIVV